MNKSSSCPHPNNKYIKKKRRRKGSKAVNYQILQFCLQTQHAIILQEEACGPFSIKQGYFNKWLVLFLLKLQRCPFTPTCSTVIKKLKIGHQIPKGRWEKGSTPLNPRHSVLKHSIHHTVRRACGPFTKTRRVSK